MEIQSSYFSYLFVLGLGQSVLLTTALWKSKKVKALSRRFFLAVLVIMTVELLYGLLYQSQAIFDFPHLLRINTVLVLGFGPALYFALSYYFKAPVKPGIHWRWHFLPSLLALLYFLPVFMASADFKLDYLNQMYQGVHPDSLIFGGFRRLQHGAYLAGMLILFKRHRPKWKAALADPYFKILLVICGLFVLMWLGDLYRYFFRFDLYSGIVNTVLMSTVLLYITARSISGSFFDQKRATKYASSALSTAQELKLIVQVEQLFEEQKSYTNPALTLSTLSSQLGVPANYLSQAINHQEGKGYNDFVNAYRVSEAKRLLNDPRNHKLTLEYIGQKSGFKSSSSFNAAFKKLAGQTPSQYRSLQG